MVEYLQGDPGRCCSDFDLTNSSVELHRKILDTYFGSFISGPSFRRNEFLKIASRTRPEPILSSVRMHAIGFSKIRFSETKAH